ncbi:MAG: hypothetical protein Q7V15_15515 [Phenylobacterium sp.]|uniref:hypothetical protein n=1 Tax=Phenylobacterium sp. TaxID=1871053 RepID=UPI00271EA232|nr:hypothetical protein [Phenylobacterium sp.]MDO8902753.1 hypothetical protein [Phenylobacterium sp.]
MSGDLVALAAVVGAAGPAFRSGVELPRIERVAVYWLLTRLLALRAAPTGVTPWPFRRAWRQTEGRRRGGRAFH